jgi:hypothetical protein
MMDVPFRFAGARDVVGADLREVLRTLAPTGSLPARDPRAFVMPRWGDPAALHGRGERFALGDALIAHMRKI